MLTIPNNLVRFFESVRLRVMIFTFFYLSLEFSRMFISASAETYPFMAILADLFFSVAIVIIFNLLYGEENTGRDVNTLNFYATIIHLIYIPSYYYGYQFAMYHNYAAQVINGLIVLRLFYFGSRQILSRIAIIEHSKKWLMSSNFFLNQYVNGLTIALFILCAIPLFTLIYCINTEQMRVTGIAIVLYAFYVAIDYSNKNRAIKAVSDAAIPMKTRTAEATQDIEAQLKDASFYIQRLKEVCKGLITLVLGLLIFGYVVLEVKNEAKFNLGYYFGYDDASRKVEPRMKADWKTLKECYLNTDYKRGPSKECIELENAMESK
jgi:hypothetical protein